MTFTEAAVQVLRLVGKPLHYKEITDVAIEKELLSHVGKSPEVTMGARLAAVVKKGGGDNPLTRVKPGVFALAEWGAEQIEQGLNDRTPALRKLAKLEAQGATQAASSSSEGAATAEPSSEPQALSARETAAALGQDEIARAALSAAATELFAAEDDDDVPLLGRVDEDDEDEDDEPEGGKRRRRRRRRGQGPERDDDDLPTYTVSEVSEEVLVEATNELRERSTREGREGRERDGREREGREARDGRERESREAREPREPREGRERESRDRDRERNGRERDGRERDREREGRDRGLQAARPGGEGVEEDSGFDLPFLVEQALANHRRSGGASFRQLADGLQRRVRGAGDPQQFSQWLAAACRSDNLRRQSAGDRPRFRLGPNGRVALWEWVLDPNQVRLEKEAKLAVERYQEVARQRLVKRLQELPLRAFGEFAQLLLEAQDLSQFRPVKRPGAHSSELHLAAVQRTALGELPVAVCVRRDARDVGREQVIELRGSLHYYGQAAFALIVSAGQVMSGAREEAALPGATPVQFIDGVKLAKLCEQTGVGVVRQALQVSLPDVDLFDALRANG